MSNNKGVKLLSDDPVRAGSAPRTAPAGLWRDRRLQTLVLAALCVGVVALVFGLVFWPHLEAAYRWRQAEQASAVGNFLEARDHLRRCLEVWPTSGEAHFRMARACRRAGDYVSARKHLELARKYQWPSAAVDLELILLFVQVNGARGPDAVTLQHMVLSNKHPEEKLILEALVKGYIHNFYLREADYWLNYWIETHPDDWFAYYWRGQMRERFHKMDEAIADYREALRLSPGQLDSALRLAQVLQQKGINVAEAKGLFELYLQAHPDDGPALLGLAQCHRDLGERDAARHVLARIPANHPSYPKALLLHALLECDQENYTLALLHLREAERLNPYEPDIVHQLAEVLNKLGRTQEAQPYFDRYKQLEADLRELTEIMNKLIGEPGDVEKRYRAGMLLLKVGQEGGVNWLMTVLRENPDHRPTHAALAEFYSRFDDPERRRLAEMHRRRAEGQPASSERQDETPSGDRQAKVPSP